MTDTSTHPHTHSFTNSDAQTNTGSTRTRTSTTLALSAAIAASLSLPTHVQAQEQPNASDTLPEVRVKAQANKLQNPNANPESPWQAQTLDSSKYSRPIAETPKSITVITRDALEDSGATDLADVLKAQPGITLGTGEGGNAFGDRFIIRGFEARNDVFTDGLRDPGVTTRETFAIEQIEVSKGPSSSFAGRGTTGGSINNVSKKPTYTDFTRAEFTLGTDNRQRYTLDTNQNLDNGLAVRLNALYSDRHVPDRDGAKEQRQGLAIAIEDQISSKLRLGFDLYHLDVNDVPDGGVPWDSITGAPVPGRHYYGQNGRDFLNAGADIATFSVNYELDNGAMLENKTRFGVTTNEYFITIPRLAAINPVTGTAYPAGTPIGVSTPGVYAAASSQNRNQKNTYFGNQTNWTRDLQWGSVKHSLVIGAELSREEVKNLPYTDALRSPNVGNPLAPNNNAWLEQGGSYRPNGNGFSEIKLDTWSVYALDTAKLNNDWEIFAGLRYDTFDYQLYSGPTDYQTGTRVSYKDSFLNGHLGATWSPWEHGNIYLTYSTSSNPSGEQLDSGANCAYGGICGTGNTKPEQNRNIELGTKWELMNKRLLLTSAVFNITKNNVLSQDTGGTITQVGKLQVQGFEVGAVGKLNDRLSISSGLAMLNTEIKASDTPSEVGQKFPNVAEQSANVQLRYQLNPKWALGGTATYTGKIYGGTPNGPVTNNSLPAHTRYDLMAEYKMDEHIKVRLNVLNATNKEYYDALYRSGAPFVYAAEGRSAFVTLVLDY